MTNDKGGVATRPLHETIILDIDKIEYIVSNNGFTTPELEAMKEYVMSLYQKLQTRIELNE